ncbi:MAG: Fic family protein [Planctomycetes bacterium]|nr:Fic family protein [Planctomycetota bacterium]
MELWLPDQIALDGASAGLLADIADAARTVNEYRPLEASVVRRIRDDLLGDRVYNSNAIEGSSLSFRETVMILETGEISGGRPREAREARNLGDAVRKVNAWLDEEKPCHQPERLLEIHGILLGEIADDYAGRYRTESVMIRAAKHQPPDASLVGPLMERVLERAANPVGVTPVIQAIWTHWAIARIHPFMDGNGRMARLWQDLVLLQARLSCAIIRPEDRREYLDALTNADDGDLNPLIQLVARRLLASFDKYFLHIREDKESQAWVTEIAGEGDARAEERSTLEYERWARVMEQLRFEFTECAAAVTRQASRIHIQVRPYDLLDRDRWENVRLGIRTDKTWFFVLDLHRTGAGWGRRFFFFFGKHYGDTDKENERDKKPTVTLLVSEADATGEGRRLDQIEACPLSLREVFVVDGHLVRKRHDLAADDDVYDRDVSALQIARDFIGEAVKYRLP